MRIGIFTDTFFPEINGVATSCYNLALELRKRGHEVHVYAPKCEGCEKIADPGFHYLPSAPLPALKDRNIAFPGLRIIRGAVKLKFDIVHTNSEFVMGTLGKFVARHSGCACVHTYHTIWEDYTYYITHGVADETAKKLAKRYSEWWCDRCTRIIVPTRKTMDLLRRYGVEGEIDIIPSGIDIERFDPEKHSADERSAIRAECGVREGERVLLNIGRLAQEKNIEMVMRVFPELLRVYPDIRFVIVGEGPVREKLQEMAEELGVADHVSIVGPRPWDVIDRYYAIGDVFASASQSETQGLTYIEAMASGNCVCAVDDPCLDGVIENGFSGYLTGASEEEFLNGLVAAFSQEAEMVKRNGIAAARRYSLPAFAAKVEDSYRHAAGTPLTGEIWRVARRVRSRIKEMIRTE